MFHCHLLYMENCHCGSRQLSSLSSLSIVGVFHIKESRADSAKLLQKWTPVVYIHFLSHSTYIIHIFIRNKIRFHCLQVLFFLLRVRCCNRKLDSVIHIRLLSPCIYSVLLYKWIQGSYRVLCSPSCKRCCKRSLYHMIVFAFTAKRVLLRRSGHGNLLTMHCFMSNGSCLLQRIGSVQTNCSFCSA